MRYFFIEQSEIPGSTSIITGLDARHIKTVLRLQPGDKIGLFDGRGYEYRAEIITFSPGRVEVSISDSFPSTAESPVQIVIAQAFLKEKKNGRSCAATHRTRGNTVDTFFFRAICSQARQETTISTYDKMEKNYTRSSQAVQKRPCYENR